MSNKYNELMENGKKALKDGHFKLAKTKFEAAWSLFKTDCKSRREASTFLILSRQILGTIQKLNQKDDLTDTNKLITDLKQFLNKAECNIKTINNTIDSLEFNNLNNQLLLNDNKNINLINIDNILNINRNLELRINNSLLKREIDKEVVNNTNKKLKINSNKFDENNGELIIDSNKSKDTPIQTLSSYKFNSIENEGGLIDSKKEKIDNLESRQPETNATDSVKIKLSNENIELDKKRSNFSHETLAKPTSCFYLDSEDGFICIICGVKISIKTNISTHLNTHQKKYIYKEEICQFCHRPDTYFSLNSLKNHFSTHFQEASHICKNKIDKSIDIFFNSNNKSTSLPSNKLVKPESPANDESLNLDGKNEIGSLINNLDKERSNFSHETLAKPASCFYLKLEDGFICIICGVKLSGKASICTHLNTHIKQVNEDGLCQLCFKPDRNKTIQGHFITSHYSKRTSVSLIRIDKIIDIFFKI